MAPPERVQLRRVKGWKMPPNTVSVARPSRWGNPYHVDTIRQGITQSWDWSGNTSGALWHIWAGAGSEDLPYRDLAAQVSVEMFRRLCARFAEVDPEDYEAWLAPLRGKNLACYCPLDRPCHADVLLELAKGDHA